ncbi:hypothetical protein PMAYCL1PPCAC_19611, partial [Pristionchus mayeri]
GLELNDQQALAVRLYVVVPGPKVFCILSPPGSGKTMVAAAMAAEVARRRGKDQSVQLLLSVQNVAVDNIGAALKKMDYGERGGVYNMKTNEKLDPHRHAPFDYFDLIRSETLEKWKKDEINWKISSCPRWNRENRRSEYELFDSKEDFLTYERRALEYDLDPKILLSTVEMVLQKMYTPSKLCGALERVRRVIIDEASLLPQAALFCIIQRFPKARIVLIGDNQQLPPFLYDEKIMGHELAGRPALSLAMKTKINPVVELNEVYRAPSSLVAPYNRLAYGGRLVSKKAEGEIPLSEIGLFDSGKPQLLMIEVEGQEVQNVKSKSFYNEKELEVLICLLKKFPREWTKEIMIICLYKDQKKRVQEVLDKQYNKDSVFDKFTVLTVDSAEVKRVPS